ncbi:hypothetical protein HDU79_009170 [Rhizoclosmatium sp. JEL0117]|nr:hypothetical protein HDU79_009170 [Rhizoclosmatium sp. JEL0117]
MAARNPLGPQGVSHGDRHRIPPRSQVIMYEVHLKEVFDKHPKSPHKARLRTVFNLLEEIIPTLGPFAPILTILKDELFRSVYSKNLTSCETDPFVERVPFFCTAGRVDEARQEEADKANESLAELQQRIRFRDHDLQILYKKNMALKQDITDYQVKVEKLQDKIRGLEDQCHKYEMEKGESAYFHTAQEHGFKSEIEKLQTTLAQKNSIIEKLTVFKSAYNDAPDSVLEEREKNKVELVIDSIGMVEYDIHQAERLQEQFAEILNYQLDDFEMALSQLRKKREIMAGVMINEVEREASYSQELEEVTAGFKKRISELLEEQTLLKQHTNSLKNVLSSYENDTKTVQRAADSALRHYSTVLHYSEDGGHTFKPWKHAPYCGKCGDRTICCPHKLGSTDPIALRQTITHIRLVRPGLKLRSYCKPGDKPAKVVSAFKDENDSDVEEGEDEQLLVTKSMKIVWEQYYDVYQGYKPKYTRIFNLERTLDYIQEIYEARVIYEEKIDNLANKDDDVQYMKFTDFFYDFFNSRYQIQEVALKAIHDLFTALAKYESNNLNVAIFIKHLCGHEDITWKYIYDCRKLFAKYNDGQPLIAPKYRQIIGILYPCRPREIYDGMELEFQAYTKNKMTYELLDEQLLHMIHKGIEPNVKFMTLCLKRYDYQETGALQYEDFDEALATLLSTIQVKHKRLMYKLVSRDNANRDSVPIAKLAMVCAYFLVHEASLHSWLPPAVNAPEVIGNLSRLLESGGKDSDKATPSSRGAKTAEEPPATQKDVDIVLKSDNIHGIMLDGRAVEEEEAKMKMRIDMAMLSRENEKESDTE